MMMLGSLRRFAVRVSGLASGLALAVRPLGRQALGSTARACLTCHVRKLKLPT